MDIKELETDIKYIKEALEQDNEWSKRVINRIEKLELKIKTVEDKFNQIITDGITVDTFAWSQEVFGRIEKLEVAIGIKDFQTKSIYQQIEELKNDLFTFEERIYCGGIIPRPRLEGEKEGDGTEPLMSPSNRGGRVPDSKPDQIMVWREDLENWKTLIDSIPEKKWQDIFGVMLWNIKKYLDWGYVI